MTPPLHIISFPTHTHSHVPHPHFLTFTSLTPHTKHAHDLISISKGTIYFKKKERELCKEERKRGRKATKLRGIEKKRLEKYSREKNIERLN